MRKQRLARLLRLPTRRWVGMGLVAFRALLLEWSLRHEPLTRTARRMKVSSASTPVPVSAKAELRLDARELELIDDVRQVISRRPFNGSCLRQALLVGRALEHRKPCLQVGVAKDERGVRAHAWLVVGGVVIDGYQTTTPDNGFVVMPLKFDGSGLL